MFQLCYLAGVERDGDILYLQTKKLLWWAATWTCNINDAHKFDERHAAERAVHYFGNDFVYEIRVAKSGDIIAGPIKVIRDYSYGCSGVMEDED